MVWGVKFGGVLVGWGQVRGVGSGEKGGVRWEGWEKDGCAGLDRTVIVGHHALNLVCMRRHVQINGRQRHTRLSAV